MLPFFCAAIPEPQFNTGCFARFLTGDCCCIGSPYLFIYFLSIRLLARECSGCHRHAEADVAFKWKGHR